MMTFSLGKADRKSDEVNGNRDCEETRQPFDTSDLDSIPEPDHEYPPYRGWWVID